MPLLSNLISTISLSLPPNKSSAKPPASISLSLSLSSTASMATTATVTKLPSTSSSAFFFSSSTRLIHHHPTHLIPFKQQQAGLSCLRTAAVRRIIACKATEVEEGETTAAAAAVSTVDDGKNWVPVVPLAALPKGERRVIIQDGETILLLWYKDEVIAIENRSPAEGAYSEGLLNAKLTQDGCIVCPTTDSTYDLRTGAVKDWYPNNPILRVLTPSLRSLFLYPVKTDDDNIYISMSQGFGSGVSAEIVFSGRAQPGVTASDVNVEEIGQGTYSSVYKARDLETGKTVALKKVRFVNMDPESVRFMAREIDILRRLDHPNVIKLEGIVTSRLSSNLYLVFDYMEHDLAGLASRPGTKFTEPQVKCFMQQLLSGLDHCHSRGVLHRDIKGSNLLVDSNGVLKIGDFGLAAVFNPEQKQQLTSRVVTLWYRPPELLLGATEYGIAVDLWSSGCILAELLAGKPIMPGRTEVEQLHKIFKLCGSPAEEYWKKSKLSDATIFRPQHQYPRCVAETFRDFPSPALRLLDKLLAIEPTERGTASSALESEFFTTKPLPCDPSSLPKFPPSKEYDAKLRDEEARRKREAANKDRGAEPAKRGSRDQSKRVQDNNSEVQKRQTNNNVGGLSVDPSRMNGYTHVGSSMHPGAYGNLRRKNMEIEHRAAPGRSVSNLKTTNSNQLRTQRSYINRYGDSGDLTRISGMVSERKTNNSRYNRLDIAEPSAKGYELDKSASSHHKKDERGSKDSSMGYGTKNKRIHYSGPLIKPGGNMEDMLKEHERQIQQAVRKARNR